MAATGNPAGDLRWFKSSFSGGSGSDCVELAILPGASRVAVRDSKRPQGPMLAISALAFSTFLDKVMQDRSHD